MEITSARGRAFAALKPAFLDVLGDLWDAQSNPDGIVNLGLAEKVQYDAHVLTYGDGFSGSHRLKNAICQFLNRYFNPRTALYPCDIAVTSGVSNALECCAWALADAGDYILVGRPYFNAFKTIFGTRPQIELLEVAFGTTDPFSIDAINEYERTYAEAKRKGLRVKALLLCSPHNPLGRCYSDDVLKEYMKFCSRNRLHLISDEIYALSVWENPRLPDEPRFKSILSFNIEDFMDSEMVHVVWGLSKGSHNMPPVGTDANYRIASLLLSDDTLLKQYISTNRRRLSESYQFATKFLQAHKVPYVECNAAFFIWLNLGAEMLARLRQEKVYVAPGTIYAAEEAGWFRMVFAHPPHVLEEGLNRMIRAVRLD
ncbi:PLP-dependent transferase [Aspergillus phoenicis ATCC 13157]|uniref:PLP-dependent transferase n=1 Tax=Aspergillus phoenicis ATCC 13157 TaxID=1353007 RepID=A0A370PTR1_ASPPH|nr:PLP-dependent transferase [Aspergillus phoenicis ATCC 13157]